MTQHLPDQRRTVHVLGEEDDAEERYEDEGGNALLDVPLDTFHQVTQASGDDVAVVDGVVVDDDSICTAVGGAGWSNVVIFLMGRELCQQAVVGRGFEQHRNALGLLLSGHDELSEIFFLFLRLPSLSDSLIFPFRYFESFQSKRLSLVRPITSFLQ